MTDRERQEALDRLTENPLTETFQCPHCGDYCEAVPGVREEGIYRNPNGYGAVLFTAVPGQRAITRTDFCSARCAQAWRLMRSRRRLS